MKRLLLILAFATPVFAQTQADRLHGRGASTFDQFSNTTVLNMTGATPSVAGGNSFKTVNGGSVTVTNFLNGTSSQIIFIICGDANTTIQNNANIAVTGGTNFTCSLNVGISFIYDATQTKWIQVGGTGTGGGGGGSPGAPINCLQKNSGSATFIASAVCDDATTTTVSDDTSVHGPNPVVDIRTYGARSVNTAIAPSIPGITASITSTQSTVTLSSASTFANGDGVVIFGAGAATGMSTPGAPTVTPSVSYAGTGTGLVVNAPSGGATTYNYQIIARSKGGGYTAASAVGTTSTGAASLGAQSVAISTLTRSGTTVTVVTSAPHGLSVGSVVWQSTTSDTQNFDGYFNVATVPDTTHYTYTAGLDSASGAPTSATGGTANWFNCNHLTWTRVTGAFLYYIYGRTGGSLTLLGVSQPDNGTSPLFWDDFGSPMMDNFAAPYYIPTTPPGAAAANHLVTTIASGAGSTTLTLAAPAAGTTVSSVTILHDEAPTILAAATAIRSTTGGTLYIPVGGFAVNSYLTLPTTLSISVAGGLTLNDTVEAGLGGRWFGNLTPQAGALPAFSWESENQIAVSHANPGIYGVLSSGNSASFHGLTMSFFAATPNNASLIFLEGDFNILEDMNFNTGGGSADYMGIALTLRGTNVNGPFPNILKNVTMIGGPNQVPAASATPVFACYICGLTRIDNVHLARRGILYVPPSAGGDIQVQFGRMQGGITPFLAVSHNNGGVIGGNYTIKNIELDTMTSAIFANLPALNSSAANVYLEGDGAPAQVPFITGQPVVNLVVNGSFGSPGQNKSFTDLTAAFFSNRSVQVNGTTGSMGYSMGRPAPPTVALSAGGGVPVATWTYSISAIDANGLESAMSPDSAPIVVTGGNQTVTITPPAAPTGSVGYKTYRHTGGGIGLVNPGSVVSWGSTTVDTAGFTSGPGGPFGVALLDGFNSANVNSPSFVLTGGGFKSTQTGTFTANRAVAWPDLAGTVAFSNAAQTWSGAQTNMALTTPAITGGTALNLALTTPTLGGETISASPRGPFNVVLPGALTATTTGETWTLDKAITVTRLQIQLKTAPSGCGTNAIIRLSDGTNNVNLTLTSAANDSGAISQNFAAAAVLTVTVQTAAATCTISPGDANVVAQYRMQ